MPDRQPIDPALRYFLDKQAAASPGPAKTPHEARARLLRQLESRTFPELPNGVEAHEYRVSSMLRARVYTSPEAPAQVPVLVYLHGGGWVAGSTATHDPFCRFLSKLARVSIVSVDYRLAPEHPYPAALEDTLTALDWVRENAPSWNGDARCVALGGDSAGGNLAAVAANRLAAHAGPSRLRALLLLYPATDHYSAEHPSWVENANGYGLEAEGMRWFWDQYAPTMAPQEPGISPLRIEPVPPLPPTLVAVAEYDVLRDEGLAYARKLERAGVPVTLMHSPDMHHDFAASPATVCRFPQSVAALGEIAGWLRRTLDACA